MRRRDKAGGKAAKTQRPKTLKRRNAPKTARRHSALAAGKETNTARLARERDEALDQLAATSEVRVGDWRVVFFEDNTSIIIVAVGNRKEIYD